MAGSGRPGVGAAWLLAACFFVPGAPARSESSGRTVSTVLYRYSGHALRDSRWGPIAQFQGALSRALQSCHQKGVEADGVFGPRTQQAIVALGTCRGFELFRLSRSHPLYGTVHTVLWQRLLPKVPFPTVHQRAFVLSLTHEATDYDQVEWNYGTSDRRSVLTWGPYGATVGHSGEVQSILATVHRQQPRLLRASFGDEYPKVLQLIRSPTEGYDALREVYQSRRRRNVWKATFQSLGANEQIRRVYDWYALQSDRWLRPALQKMYDGFIPGARTQATEVDYAFFLDIAMHMSVSDERVASVKAELARARARAGRALAPAERRRVIALSLVPSRAQQDRLGRNVVYYVDGFGVDRLTPLEATAWLRRSALRASSCGLSDRRAYYPANLD